MSSEATHIAPISVWRSQNLGLFIWLSGFFLVYPHVPGQSFGKLVLDVLYSGVIALSLVSQRRLPRFVRIVYTLLGVAAILSTWIPGLGSQAPSVEPLLYSLFFAASVVIHFSTVLTRTEVDLDSLFAAACTYLLLGLFFAALYGLMDSLDPNSFSIPDGQADLPGRMVYFSFITLTTLGYGDVLPTSHAAQMLAAYEAVIGQLFIAGIIGVLVGRHVSNAQPEK